MMDGAFMKAGLLVLNMNLYQWLSSALMTQYDTAKIILLPIK